MLSLLIDLVVDVRLLLHKYTERLLNPLRHLRHLLSHALSSLTWLTFRTALLTVGLLVFLLLTLLSSLFFYTFTYALLIPDLSLSLPVVFDFSLPHPTATIPLHPPTHTSHLPLHLPSSSLPSPPRSTSSSSSPHPLLYPHQSYDVVLHLTLPDSPHNSHLGVVTLHSTFAHHHLPLASSTSSFLPPYRSTLTRVTLTLLSLPYLFLPSFLSPSPSPSSSPPSPSSPPHPPPLPRLCRTPSTLHSTHLNLTLLPPHGPHLRLVGVR